ncbi:RNA pseudouridine synthase [Trueperella sp. HMSC08B05]|uniref:Pseudouridine synthase n=2 Tax=Actinomycetaceae TaxID=2049 RepID=A0A0W1KMS0_9ACTO|nr:MULTISPECIES: RluA family pseudouridine synthase [Trueperella]KTF04828.1 Ribosomal large subunit pseudouridine synthase D [Trueperella bernardiae]MCM3907258.1 RluA family pseudouridine synthase [Trueperella bernardiae]MDK8601227.1 RluA family pseudouridine synthase [Trueperella bernardiae]MDV6238615.1 RluA family pseudouridine synthase [Trueperella bernardiae]OCW61074.1 pseudouridine synthase [Trueperella bernardiae]
MNTYLVPDGLAGGRVDATLATMTGLSRAKCAELVERGDVLLDGARPKNSTKVGPGSVLEVELPVEEPLVRETPVAGMGVIFEDEDIIVVDKPAGVAAHASQNFEGPNVLGALLASGVRLTTSGPQERQGIVHRLDVGTSGAMVVAKSERAYSGLKHAFRERTVTKVYHALIQGHPDPMSGTVEAPIGRDMRHQWKMGVRADGKHAITHYDVIEAMPGASLVEVHLETGRTHQIRVHMSAIKHPCLGDVMYGADPVQAERLGLERQWLHAVKLGFEHPTTGHYIEFESPYAEDLARALTTVREGYGLP